MINALYIKNLINELLKNYELKRIPTIVYSKCKTNKELKNFIFDDKNTFGENFSQRLYNIFYDIKEWPKCEYNNCNNYVKFQHFHSGYRKTCSKWCTNYIKYGCKSTFATKEQHIKAQKTLLEKTGYRSGTANPETRKKIINTMNKKYGCLYQQTEEFKQKCEKTNIKRYGAKHIMCTNDGIKRSKNTQIKKYGCLYQQTEEFKKLASSQFYEKHKCEKMAKGQRDAYYNKLKKYVDKNGYELLFSKDNYKAQKDKNKKWIKYPIKCKTCGYSFEITFSNINRDGINCPKCYKTVKSIIQHNLFKNIKIKYPNYSFIEDENRILDNHQEIDIYCENLSFGIEYNGNCWHAQKYNNKGKYYHFNKYLNFIKHKINVLSFWSDEFNTHKEYINELINLFLNPNISFNDINFIFNYTVNNNLLSKIKQRCFSEINSNDKFLIIENNNTPIACLKYDITNKNILKINDIIHFEIFNFKLVIEKLIKQFNNYVIMFELDNRLMPYYKLWIDNYTNLEKIIEPSFYIFNKKRSIKLYNDLSKINLEENDIIWSYGKSLFVIK